MMTLWPVRGALQISELLITHIKAVICPGWHLHGAAETRTLTEGLLAYVCIYFFSILILY